MFWIWILVANATAGAIIGPLIGERVVRRIPEPLFRIVAILLLALGAYMILRG